MKRGIVGKSYLLVISAIVILALGVFAVSALFSVEVPWHPLQQVSTTASSGISVDANENGKVDDSDKVQGLSAADLMAGGGVSGRGISYTILIIGQNNADCPAGFAKKTIGEMAGWNDYFYSSIGDNNLYLGGLYSWDTYSLANGGSNGFIRTRTPASWGGYVCWKVYDITASRPPHSEIYGVDNNVECSTFGEGYNTFELNKGQGNGYTHIMQAPFGMVIAQLDWWDRWSAGEPIMRQWYNYDHVGKTCWKVINLP